MSEAHRITELPAELPLITARRGFTVRSVILGGGLSFLLNVACPYCVLIMKNAGLTSDYITAGAVMLFFVLVAMLNPILKVFCPKQALSSAELVLIYVMMIVASAIPTWGLLCRPNLRIFNRRKWRRFSMTWAKLL